MTSFQPERWKKVAPGAASTNESHRSSSPGANSRIASAPPTSSMRELMVERPRLHRQRAGPFAPIGNRATSAITGPLSGEGSGNDETAIIAEHLIALAAWNQSPMDGYKRRMEYPSRFVLCAAFFVRSCMEAIEKSLLLLPGNCDAEPVRW